MWNQSKIKSKKTISPKIIVVMPAYNAEKTLEKTVRDFPKNLVYKTILVDDGSTDKTVEIAKKLGLTVFSHTNNLGYGGNQKTCYWEALKEKPDVVIMVHPDYQYDSSLIGELTRPILENRYDMTYGNRIRTRHEVLNGGMPLTKYLLNRYFCILENMILGANFSEYFSGLRAYSGKLLNEIPFQRFSNDFVFDQQFMISTYANEYRIGEIDIPVRYLSESSSIQFIKGSKFLLQTISVLFKYLLYKYKIIKDPIFTIYHAK
ncbi:MAG: Glycosyl transferase, group 2 family protein [Candidatus Gottesmanbacteria bacterium GW2011_GWA1_34_13]|uniref:Glycosyl transferase, group 2 family protein n=1 Tax=Candidatus Gottesmanbacteria bacterium GW2011_GWA1_34_13 TaxID=1618434 RepID=A0A0G0ASX9_9BACT|nr:MAG: Glycosyl transferase, group 2 family protein [Candidatus Gottesmanbacteria bacterium GW2011_GWA1_34_13]